MNDHMALLVSIIVLVAQLGIPIPTFPVIGFGNSGNLAAALTCRKVNRKDAVLL
jgi:hypothetical protein